MAKNDGKSVHRVAMLGNYVPRQCGIATFTADVAEALANRFQDKDFFAVAMNDTEAGYKYPDRVRFQIHEKEIAEYRRAADFLNINDVDLLCVQHEYGIFGGKAGAHLLALLRELRMPVVTTLHTILREPNEHQRAVMDELVRRSERLIVMSEKGLDFMQEVHNVPASKMDLIHHGIPSIPEEMQGRFKELLGVTGDSVILTFGLLGPDKGIEYVIQALPEVLAKHPDVVYMVVGATHPHIRANSGESYRMSLENLAQKLGVDNHVVFYNRFVSQNELNEFLGAADIYVTPYLKPEQITSGTLAYAVGSGKAVISTPYWYAQELLDDGRGILVPWRDPKAIAEAVCSLLDSPEVRKEMRRRAKEFGKQMLWPAVATSYMASFEEAAESWAGEPKDPFHARSLASRPAELPAVSLTHLKLMTDQTGMLQHATFAVPNYDEGYCLDDNARALMLMAQLEESGYEDTRDLRLLAARYLAFVHHAFSPANGRFRNFLSYDRRWAEEVGSEDSHGRAIGALGTVIGRSYYEGNQGLARRLFGEALPATRHFISPRAWAFTILGIDEYLKAFPTDSAAIEIAADLAQRLYEMYKTNSTPEWPWFEDVVSYANGRLSQAMLVAGHMLSQGSMVDAGLQSLEWLVKIQQEDGGHFAPIGSNGFYHRGGVKARFDQQPIEAWGMVSACLDAFRLSGDEAWNRSARRAFNWFLGDNDAKAALNDPITGGCRDGLHDGRLNENQGAESTLAFLLALVEMRLADNARAGKGAALVYS
jgi:glycosyltransferase involved in cell wall biosynthesis